MFSLIFIKKIPYFLFNDSVSFFFNFCSKLSKKINYKLNQLPGKNIIDISFKEKI